MHHGKNEKSIKFAAAIAKFNDRGVFYKHKDRSTIIFRHVAAQAFYNIYSTSIKQMMNLFSLLCIYYINT